MVNRGPLNEGLARTRFRKLGGVGDDPVPCTPVASAEKRRLVHGAAGASAADERLGDFHVGSKLVVKIIRLVPACERTGTTAIGGFETGRFRMTKVTLLPLPRQIARGRCRPKARRSHPHR